MKKEIVIATLITGLLTSISAEESKSVKIKEIKVDKVGKIEASKQIKSQIKKEQNLKIDQKAWGDTGCNNNCGEQAKLANKIKDVEKVQLKQKAINK